MHQEQPYYKKRATSGNFTCSAVLLSINVKVTGRTISVQKDTLTPALGRCKTVTT